MGGGNRRNEGNARRWWSFPVSWRGRRGGNTRANQALELVRGQPGITIPEIAKSMKIEPNYLYRVMANLQSDGAVKKQGKGYVAT